MHTDHQTSKPGGEVATPRVIEMELLALDLTSCTRCVGTHENMARALDTVRSVLELTGHRVHVSTLVIASEAQAHQHQFVTSPTVRINGNDIAFETLESTCDSCTDLCGCNAGINCRVWRYRGEEYTEAPVGLIVEAVLREIFATGSPRGDDTPAYGDVPPNLRRFFAAKGTAGPVAHSCCPPATQETCCDSDQKGACCDDAEPEACGCHRAAGGASREYGAQGLAGV